MDLVKINELDYDEVLNSLLSEDEQVILEVLKDIFMCIPQHANIYCRCILDLIKHRPDLAKGIQDTLQGIVVNSDTASVTTGVLYIKKLNFKCNMLNNIVPIQNDVFVHKHIEIQREEEVNEYLNSLEMYLRQNEYYISKPHDSMLFHTVLSIIANYKFDINVSISELKDVCDTSMVYLGILYLMQNGSDKKRYDSNEANEESVTLQLNECMNANATSCNYGNSADGKHSVYDNYKVPGDMFYYISLVLRLIEEENTAVNFFLFVKQLNKFLRDLFVIFVYERFINKRQNRNLDEVRIFDTPEEVAVLKEYIDTDTAIKMSRYCSMNALRVFIPEYAHVYETDDIVPITKEEFSTLLDKIGKSNLDHKNSDDATAMSDSGTKGNFDGTKKMNGMAHKDELYCNFCLLGSPSITHFLSYLELYKKHFIMNREEQMLFVKMFTSTFSKRHTFKRIVLQKMVQFGFLQKDLL